MSKDYDSLYKMIIIGNSSVGKSAIMVRRCNEIYTDSTMSTIGVDFRYSVIDIDGKIIKLQIWDTAGQERFRTITSAYYRGVNGVIIVYDITNKHSFEKISFWIDECKRKCSNIEQNIIFLVGNKCDQKDKRKVSFEEGKKCADDNGFLFFEVSAKEDININELFFHLAKEMDRIGSKRIIKKIEDPKISHYTSKITCSIL